MAVYADRCDCPHPLVAEARAILRAAQLAIDKGWDVIIVESECQEAVESIDDGVTTVPWVISNVVNKIRLLFGFF